MSRITPVIAMLARCLVLACAATIVAQAVGAGVLWKQGMLSRDKLVRYAGVFYGLHPLDLTPPGQESDATEPAHEGHDAMLAARTETSATIRGRRAAIRKGTDDMRAVVMGLKVKRERQELSRKAFDTYLGRLEKENQEVSLREIYLTLEGLPPSHAKEILRKMLTESPNDPQAMEHVVAVLRMMPAEKARKTISEFKTEEERDLLHEILVQIGNLGNRSASLPGA